MTGDKNGTATRSRHISWPGVVALLGASLPWLLVGGSVLWWNLRGRPSGGDVLWYYVILMVPALLLGAIMVTVGFVRGKRARRKGALSDAGNTMLNLALAVCALTALTAIVMSVR